MIRHAFRCGGYRRLALVFVALFMFSGVVQAQAAPQDSAKRSLTVDDYSRWRSVGSQQISSDGTWVSYVLRFTNSRSEDAEPILHFLNLETDEVVEVPDATGASFSEDSRWVAYRVDPGEGGEGRGNRGQEAEAEQEGGGGEEEAQRRVELRNLATGSVRSWVNIQSFTFSDNSTHLMLRKRPTGNATGGRGGGGSGGGGDGSDDSRGVDVIVHDLTTGLDLLLGSVGDISFNKEGDLLAYTVDASKDSNGLFVLDLGSGRIHPLDNDAKSYNRLTWDEDGTALAVLKGVEVEDMRERDNVLVVFPNVGTALATDGRPSSVVLDPSATENFPEGWVVSDRAALSWSEDNTRVFFGIKEQVEEPDAENDDTDEVPNVDVWNTLDERIQSVQMRRANSDRNRTYQQAFVVGTGTFVKLADETMRDLNLAPEGPWAVGRDTRGYIHDWKPAAADVYRVDTRTGERILILSNHLTGDGLLGFSADGGHYLYWEDEKIHAYDLDAGTSRMLGGETAPSFIDVEDDHFGPRPSYGIAGYTADGTAAIAQTRYDLWVLPLDGSDAWSLTSGEGAENEIRFRYVDLDPDDPPAGGGGRGSRSREIDLSEPLTLTAYGQWTKKAGFYRLADGELTPIVYEDARFSTPTKAEEADRFIFTRQTFQEFPDLRVFDFNDRASSFASIP